MADDRITTPSSSAGLVRFSDVTTSKVQITPELVLMLSVAFIVVEIAAHFVVK